MASPSEAPSIVDSEQSISNITNGTAASSSLRDMVPHLDLMFLEFQIVFSALAIIFLGAHGALRRPPSAAPPPQKCKHGKRARKPEDDHFAEGLQASDAITFPILAGTLLIGLYYLIMWLQDPTILNKFLRGYMCIMGVASTGKLIGDMMQFSANLVFPEYWRNKKGQIFKIDPRKRCHWLLKSPANDDSNQELDEEKDTPLPFHMPGWVPLPDRTKKFLWEFRHLLTEEWSVRIGLHGIGKETFDVKLTSVLGILIGLVTTLTYFMTSWSALSNLMGVAFCYTAFMVLSPTSFAIGSMVLAGLFIYDIVMVFYTPFMITVATKIDAPIKLVFDSGGRSSLLGLGDIVVPGIFICLALRFDIWKHYQFQSKYVPTELKTVTKSPSTKDAITTVETHYRAVRTTFVDPQGQWGNRFWTTPWTKLFSPHPLKKLNDATFPKTYFHATMTGYTLGMVATLVVLLVFKHGQPALLYLVPGVVGSAWLTGLYRGELKEMWKYTEDGSLDVEDVVVELDGAGQVIREIEHPAKKPLGQDDKASSDKSSVSSNPSDDTVEDKFDTEATGKVTNGEENSENDGKTDQDAKTDERRNAIEEGYDVFLFSISTPGTKED